jgi:isoquinoline 1-oxidoreductase beta subunit
MADVIGHAAQISQRVKRPVKLVWTRESDMTQAWYRPVYAAKVVGGVRDGKVSGIRMRVLSQSIALSAGDWFGAILSSLPRSVLDMLSSATLAIFSSNSFGDPFSTEGIQNTPYRFGNFQLASEPVQTKLPVASWRSVGNSVTGFIMESFVDELAVAAKQDPFALRRTILPAASRQVRVLDALEKLSGWATPPPKGTGRGMARHQAFDTEVGQVAEVELVGNRIRVKKVYCVADCGIAVNPDVIRAQMEGGIGFALGALYYSEIELKAGRPVQRNFDQYKSLRIYEMPVVEVFIVPSTAAPTGVGEPGVPPLAPAVANAVVRAGGPAVTRLPFARAGIVSA